MPTFEYASHLPFPVQEVFDWHKRPGALERMVPPFQEVRILESQGSLTDGSTVTLEMRQGPVNLRWEAKHFDYIEGKQFCDEAVSGPFKKWVHQHLFEPDGDQACIVRDVVDYELPLGNLGKTLGGGFARESLENAFFYRHQQLKADLERHRQFAEHGAKKVAITGASGLIGSTLANFLRTGGHEVYELVRRTPKNDHEIEWDPKAGQLNPECLEGIDIVIHLAGKPIAEGRWTETLKREIYDSRIEGTKLIAKTLATLERKPEAFLCASAIGYYGGRGDEVLTEASGPGKGFLSDVCVDWEASCQLARDAGIRTANMRIGVVLSGQGGALQKMLPIFKLNLGGGLGSGHQYMSWIDLDDIVGAFQYVMFSDIAGPVNLTAPQPATNKEFTKTLNAVLGRWTVPNVPTFMLKALLGEMADTLLLEGARVVPRVLEDHGFAFRYRELERSLRFQAGALDTLRFREPMLTEGSTAGK